jgi:hypothetical protein
MATIRKYKSCKPTKPEQSSIDWFIEQFNSQIQFRPGSELDEWYKTLIADARVKFEQDIKNAYSHGQNNGYMYAREKSIDISVDNYYKTVFKP